MLITRVNGRIEVEKIFQKYFDKMNYLSNKEGFLGIDNKFKIKERAILSHLDYKKQLVMVVEQRRVPEKLLKLLIKLNCTMKN